MGQQISPPSKSPAPKRRKTNPPTSSSTALDEKAAPCPACPGVFKTRPETTRAILHYESEILDAYRKLKEETRQEGEQGPDEEAFLELLKRSDIHSSDLSNFSSKHLNSYIMTKKRRHGLTIRMIGQELQAPFSRIPCRQVGPYIYQDPVYKLREMRKDLRVSRSRIPNDLFMEIVGDWDMAVEQYGPLLSHDSEKGRSGIVSSLRAFFLHFSRA